MMPFFIKWPCNEAFQTFCYGARVALLLLLVACNKAQKSPSPNEKPLFETLDAAALGIGFRNELQPDTSLNIIDYIYYYNGGGVAAGDIDNDGLPDIYFSANQSGNKLYRNKGNFQFEDITEKAGVAASADWTTGVTMADVNGDGWLDIYVCAVSADGTDGFRALKGRNQLFINRGNGTFEEQAARYGLDFSGYGTHSTFFDYDRDGDLDCFLLNHAVHDANSYTSVSKGRNLQSKAAGDYLLRNDDSRFTDVSAQAGILQSSIGYGLGVATADFNNDGWMDIYVSNDFHEDDYYYINQGNGRFREQGRESFKHFSRFSMGCDAADINNDGLMDLFTLDMLPEDHRTEKESLSEDPFDIYLYKLSFGYHYQYARNCLQLNRGNNRFSEIASLAGIAATDWSWSPLFADFDHDGNQDLFVSNGIAKRPNNLDYINYVYDYAQKNPSSIQSKAYYLKAFELMPSGTQHNYCFRGSGDSLRFTDKSVAWGFAAPDISNGAACADLDGDGDLDLVSNRIGQSPGLWRNQQQSGHSLLLQLQGEGKNTFGIGTTVTLFTAGKKQVRHLSSGRGFQSSCEPILHFGLGAQTVADSLQVRWPSGKMQMLHNIGAGKQILREKDAFRIPKLAPITPTAFVRAMPAPFVWKHRENDFHDFNREPLIPFKISTEGPALAVGDANGDGLDDVFLGGAKLQSGSLWLQQADGRFAATIQPALAQDSICEDVDACWFDADADRDLDLYVVSGGNEFFGAMPEQYDRLYFNDGLGHLSKAPAGCLPPMPMNKSCVRPADFDGDGDIDLFTGGRVMSNAYGKMPDSYLLENDGKGCFRAANIPGLKGLGMVTDAQWADLNGDGKKDLAIVGEWMPLTIYYAVGAGFEALPIAGSSGLWHSLAAADIDNDGDTDLVAGNLGTNTKLRKGQNPALRLQAADVDGNGKTEQILSYTRDGKWWPLAHKDEVGKLLPGLVKKRFVYYKDYAASTTEDIFGAKILQNIPVSEVQMFESACFFNEGQQRFRAVPLPLEAQFSTVFSICPADYNDDGKIDLLLGGNYYEVNPYQSRYDAGYGTLLLGAAEGRWSVVPSPQSGFLLDGQVRKIRSIRLKSGLAWVAIRNNDTPLWFR